MNTNTVATSDRLVRFFLADSLEVAQNETSSFDVTVEAEYGSAVVEGRLYTAAHHVDAYRARPAPCNDHDLPQLEEGRVLLSHFDLDTLGGCLRTLPGVCFEELVGWETSDFWELAEFVDLNGAHRLGESGASDEDLDRLHAFWAWSRENRLNAPRGELTDVSDFVYEAAEVLRRVFDGDEELLAAGRELRRSTEELNKSSYVDDQDGVVVRVAREFTNHLYTTPKGVTCKCVVAWNPQKGVVTVSLADPAEGLDVAKELQKLFGELAGGHATIGGSPRGEKMGVADFARAAQHFTELLG